MIVGKLIKHFLGKPVVEAYDVLGGHFSTLNITTLKAIPINRRESVTVTVKCYDVNMYSSTTPNARLFCYVGSTFENNSWENLANWKSIDGSSTFTIFTSIMYDALKTLQTANGLIVGATYLITDYRTLSTQPQTGLPIDGEIEPLFITAISNNKFSSAVRSALYPLDVIMFDFNFTSARAPRAKGFIIYRSIRGVINTFFDSRGIKYRRYAPTPNTYTPSTVYVKNSMVISDSKYYISRQDLNSGKTPATSPDYWVCLEGMEKNKYILYKPDQFSWIPCDGTDFIDVYFISKLGQPNTTTWWESEITDGKIGFNKNVSWDSTNTNVFYETSISEISYNIAVNTTLNLMGANTDIVLSEVSGSVVLGNVKHVKLENITGSYISGIFDSEISGGLLNSKLLATISGSRVSVSSSIGSRSLDLYAPMSDCTLRGFSNVVMNSSLLRVDARNWHTVTIPQNVTFEDCTFLVPQWKGKNVWTGAPLAVKGVNVTKYSPDNYTAPNVELLWFEVVNGEGNTTLNLVK